MKLLTVLAIYEPSGLKVRLELTRIPCLGEIVEAPAPLASKPAFTLWEVVRVVHHHRVNLRSTGLAATLVIRTEGT